MQLSLSNFAAHLEHSLLLPDATAAEVAAVCEAAKAHQFAAVCLHPCRVLQAYHLLMETPVKIAALIGYPGGASEAEIKAHEAELAVDVGAHEIEMVLNMGRLKDGDDRAVLRELRDVVEASSGTPVKVIVEPSRLSAADRRRAASLIVESGARFLVLGTGYHGSHPSDVREWHAWCGQRVQIKVAGGIREASFALELIAAGAARLGSTDAPALLKTFEPIQPHLN